MNIKTASYQDVIASIPAEGKHILGYQTETEIVVYQAYKPEIALFAVQHQCLGGHHFSYDRMSWIKPGFLWMMYRCGWATKEDQERVLAMWIDKDDFKKILAEAVPTTYKSRQYQDPSRWKEAMKQKEVRLQWDPDHDPFGRKQERKAIQLGLKGNMLKAFGNGYIRRIEDITDFVSEQRLLLKTEGISALHIPVESVMEVEDTG